MTERMDLGTAMRDALPVFDASPELREWAREQARRVDEETRPEAAAVKPRRPRLWSAGRMQIAAGLLLAAVSGLGVGSFLIGGQSSSEKKTNAVIDAHVRSMLPGHLLDVRSTDRHTVKPWFAGKTDIAPEVFDLSEKGFPLFGGRLDYVDGHSVAALVYGRRLHTINLFVSRQAADESREGSYSARGYTVVHWTSNGLSYWAVSDAAAPELEAFHDAYTK
jgi:anti-sigma factor RsiW